MAGTAPTHPDEAAATDFIAPGAAAARERSERLQRSTGPKWLGGRKSELLLSVCSLQSSVHSRESGACVAGRKVAIDIKYQPQLDNRHIG